MKAVVTVILTILSCCHAFGQNNWSNWYFGNYAGLHFSPAPTPLTGGQTTQLEGVASISDDNGNLLFYSDGQLVWDRTHNIMPNGSGLQGGWSSAQSALIVPIPGQAQRYYHFAVNDRTGPGDLTVSIINMGLNGGLGNVEAIGKNQLLATRQTEKLVAASASSCGVWVITHQHGTAIFESRLVTATGIASPVYSAIGSVHTEALIPPYNITNLTGMMKVSRDNRTIALATLGGIVELFRFDASTGIISDPIAIPTTLQGYGVCFSPDQSKLYITEGVANVGGYDISQFELSTYTSAAINSSKTFIGRATQPSATSVGDLQAAPDGKIYFTKSETFFLGCIPSPNLPAPLCGFIDNAINIGHVGLIGLPNEIRQANQFSTFKLGNDTALCIGKTLTLTAPSSASYLWSTGAITDQITVAQTGSYWVRISDGICFASDTIEVVFHLLPLFIGNDTTLCAGKRITLNAGSADDYLWSNGETASQIEVSAAGEYSVEINRDGCRGFDTVMVSFQTLPGPDLGNDTAICSDLGYSISPPLVAGTEYLWQDGSTNPGFFANHSGKYWLQIKDRLTGCMSSDTILLDIRTTPNFTLGEDTVTCEPEVELFASATASSYLWSTGNTHKNILVSASGLYWLQLNNGTCFYRDSIQVDVNHPTINIGADTTICDETPFVLDAGNQPLDYTWQDGSKGNRFNVKTPGLYVVTADDGVCTVKDSIQVDFNKKPAFNLGADKEFCNGDVVVLGANLSNAYSYIWEDGSTSSLRTVNRTGAFTLTASNECGSFADEIIIKPGECALAIPNAFTPNGDGKNDVFRISKTNPLASFSMQVFNRWGQKIFESRDQSQGWNGAIGNASCDAGSYAYIIQFRKIDGTLAVLKGMLLLIR